ncbi:MAG: hypothetical protein JWR39_727 [Devosia sp.]|jgi:biopolymer transport protein ExbB/TolQ|nr:hypothetical protein [Devosia sp.]
MFMGADFVVKGVMIGLLLASIATWRPAAVSIRCNRELTRSLSPLLAAKINNGFSALHLLLCCQNQRGADPGLARQRPDGLMKAGRRL